tara:strand:+ start:617 stop:748 length:132 start_codon:yes stop_codon:yes gene_type:complete
MSYLLFAALLTLPTLYYRKKLKECETKTDKLIKTRWQWEDWGE